VPADAPSPACVLQEGTLNFELSWMPAKEVRLTRPRCPFFQLWCVFDPFDATKTLRIIVLSKRVKHDDGSAVIAKWRSFARDDHLYAPAFFLDGQLPGACGSRIGGLRGAGRAALSRRKCVRESFAH
jgi:hypothetical protein